MCTYAHGWAVCMKVWQPSLCCLPNSVDSGFSESPQLKPNVITVFVKGLDRRLKGGYSCVYLCDVVGGTILCWASSSYSFLIKACPLSWEGSAHHRLVMMWRHCAPAFVLWPLLIMAPLSSHSWRGQDAGRRGVKDRSVYPHLVKSYPLMWSGKSYRRKFTCEFHIPFVPPSIHPYVSSFTFTTLSGVLWDC